jgi:DNA-binding NarL/FixJ family response regulator
VPELTRDPRHEHPFGRAPMNPHGLNRLAADQLDILSLLAKGLTIEAIARRLDMSERTVRRKVRAVAIELGVDSTIEAVVWAVRQGLI